MAEPWCLVLSCEHGGNRVPAEWRHLFAGREEVLASHRGFDTGAAECARYLAAALRAPLHLAEVTRLLVELNRSPGHPALFSAFSRELPRAQREALLGEHYHPYRDALARRIEALQRQGRRVCHVSVHSFTPELDGKTRNADAGLLYDPRRTGEQAFCLDWQRRMRAGGGLWRVRRNYPYLGRADGLVTFLRRRFSMERYLGIELELNQRWPIEGGERWRALQARVCESLRDALAAAAP